MPETLPSHLPTLLTAAARLVAEAVVREEERARASHERFNVFTTLLKEDDEVRLHTRFLQALLNPHGLHDCGALFLELFFATLKENPGQDHDDRPCPWEAPAAGLDWTVEKETGRSSGLGQIDLLLTHRNCAIAIENKIHAREQTQQLSGYSEFLKNLRKQGARLIYLTKDGKRSESHDDEPYLRISYSGHILPWLEACLRATYRIVPVNQVLIQYRDVVRKITGYLPDTPAMKPVIDYVKTNLDIIRYRGQLNQAVDEAKAQFLDDLAAGILANLSQDFAPKLREDHTEGRFGKDKEGDIKLKMPAGSQLASAPFGIFVEHDTGEKVLLIGAFIEEDIRRLSEEEKALLQRVHGDLSARSAEQGLHHHQATERWPLGWHNLLEDLDDAGMARLMEKPLDALVQEVCGKVRRYLKLLEELYAAALPKDG